MNYAESIRRDEIRARQLAAQATASPDGPIARKLKRYETAATANLRLSFAGFRADLTAGTTAILFFTRYGIHPQAVIEARQTATTVPDRVQDSRL